MAGEDARKLAINWIVPPSKALKRAVASGDAIEKIAPVAVSAAGIDDGGEMTDGAVQEAAMRRCCAHTQFWGVCVPPPLILAV